MGTGNRRGTEALSLLKRVTRCLSSSSPLVIDKVGTRERNTEREMLTLLSGRRGFVCLRGSTPHRYGAGGGCGVGLGIMGCARMDRGGVMIDSLRGNLKGGGAGLIRKINTKITTPSRNEQRTMEALTMREGDYKSDERKKRGVKGLREEIKRLDDNGGRYSRVMQHGSKNICYDKITITMTKPPSEEKCHVMNSLLKEKKLAGDAVPFCVDESWIKINQDKELEEEQNGGAYGWKYSKKLKFATPEDASIALQALNGLFVDGDVIGASYVMQLKNRQRRRAWKSMLEEEEDEKRRALGRRDAGGNDRNQICYVKISDINPKMILSHFLLAMAGAGMHTDFSFLPDHSQDPAAALVGSSSYVLLEEPVRSIKDAFKWELRDREKENNKSRLHLTCVVPFKNRECAEMFIQRINKDPSEYHGAVVGVEEEKEEEKRNKKELESCTVLKGK